MRNATLPIVTVIGMTGAGLLGATIFIEQIFNIQGFGMMVSKGLQRGDIMTVTGAVLVSTVIVMLFSLLVDLLYGLIDPRVRVTKIVARWTRLDKLKIAPSRYHLGRRACCGRRSSSGQVPQLLG